MSRASHYRAQADLARRLAEMTVQPNLERELCYIAEELDHLANEIAGHDTDFVTRRHWNHAISCGLIDVGAIVQNRAGR